MVHINQYGFLKDRVIQDCLGWAYEYIHQCHKSREEILIIKLDFEKAFDTIEHEAIFDIFKAKGFGDRWISWMKALFSTASSSVLMNGVRGKENYIKRGVRQGDPYSPLIFVLAADLLQSIVNKAMRLNLLSAPLQVNSCPHFPIVQYADDTLVIMQEDTRHLFCLKALLNTFASATWLKVNYGKSFLVPLNISVDRIELFTNTLQCAKGEFPFTYLGLPLGIYKTNSGTMSTSC